MLENLLRLFSEYMGTGLITVWFLFSVIYLFVFEKKKEKRVMLVYMPVLALVLFFNPAFAGIVYSVLDDEIYYRLLWLLPVTVTTAYTVTDIYGRLCGRKKIYFAGVAVVLVIVSGSLIYSDSNFHAAENVYHVPDSVVDICDAIEVEGREVTAVFPAELLQYVRQYSGTVCMPYGREMIVDRWNNFNELYNIMESDVPDASELASEARSQSCVYIVLSEDKEIAGSLAAYDFEEFGKIDGYIIYIDTLADLSI
ncbi:MAG: hypothetical protein LUG83_10140 [Lachnospiraceae bacterium]|nr:hypothetical protein [Lachnospiraceae bacterium]